MPSSERLAQALQVGAAQDQTALEGLSNPSEILSRTRRQAPDVCNSPFLDSQNGGSFAPRA